MDEWSLKLATFPLQSLTKPFQVIAGWHENIKEDTRTYGFSEKGMQVYRLFSNEMAHVMNEQWDTGDVNEGNMSKDKRTMIRYSQRQLDNSCGENLLFFMQVEWASSRSLHGHDFLPGPSIPSPR